MDNPRISTAFPPDNVSPEKKADPKYGLQVAQAIWFHNDAYAPAMFYKDKEAYNDLIRYSFGQQSEDKVKPAMGVTPKNQEQSFLGGISWKTKSFVTKLVMITVNKMFNRKYDPVASAIDPLSYDRKLSFQASVKTWMDSQQWLAEKQQMLGVDVMPEGMNTDSLPDNDDALELYMQNDYKLNDEIDLELGIQYHTKRLDFDKIKEIADFYLTVLGVGGVKACLDNNSLPELKILNQSKLLIPHSEFNNFKRLAYAGYVDEYTVAEFRKLVGNSLEKYEIDNLIKLHATKGNYLGINRSQNLETVRDVDKILVLHFEIPQTDEYVFMQYVDKYGNERMLPKPYEYYNNEKSGPEDFKKKYGKNRAIHRIPKQTVYSGYWVVGSETVFRWGETNYLNGELSYIIRATNMIDGFYTSMVAQMKPHVDNIELYDKKIQQIIASTIPQAVTIDLDALRNVTFKMGDKNMGPAELIELFFAKGVLVTDTKDWGAQQNTKRAIYVEKIGMNQDVINYLTLMKEEMAQLENIIGYNIVSSASTLNPETGARVAQQMNMATETAIDHLYRADREICQDVYKALAHLHRESVKLVPEFYIPVLGQEAVMRVLQSPPHTQYGIDIEARPTAQEWSQFYLEINDFVKIGMITPADKVALIRFNNLKQAQNYLSVLTKKRVREAQQFELQKIRENAAEQQKSAVVTAQEQLRNLGFERETVILEKDLEDRNADNAHKRKLKEINELVNLQTQGKLADTTLEGEYSLEKQKISNKNSSR